MMLMAVLKSDQQVGPRMTGPPPPGDGYDAPPPPDHAHNAPVAGGYGAPPHPDCTPVTHPPPGLLMVGIPIIQIMDIERIPGLIVKQRSQVLVSVAETVGIPYEAINKFDVYLLPEGKKAMRKQNDPEGFTPNMTEVEGLPRVMYVEEESNCCLRILLSVVGCLNLRPFKLHFFLASQTDSSTVHRYVLERPFRLGACLGCPHQVTVKDAATGALLGRAEEPCSFWSACCMCWCCFCCELDVYEALAPGMNAADFQARDGLVKKYRLSHNFCCCGRVNNCCGATCCNPNYIIDVVDMQGKQVSSVQKTFGTGSCADLCRCAMQFENYVVEFPRDAGAAARMALLGAVLLSDYVLWARRFCRSFGP